MKSIGRANRIQRIKLGTIDIMYVFLCVNIVMSLISYTLIVRAVPAVSFILGKLTLLNRCVLILLWMIVAVKGTIKLYRLAFFILFMALVGLEYYYLRQWLLFDVFFVPVFWGRSFHFERVRQLYLYSYVLTIVILAVFSLLGAFNTYVFVRGDGRQRYSLGFLHPNLLGVIVLCVCFLFFLRIRKHDTILEYILFPVCAIFLWVVPNSMTNTVLLLVSWFGILVIDLSKRLCIGKKRWIGKKWQLGFVYTIIGLGIVGIFGIIYKGWGREWISRLSGTLYTRFIHGYNGIRMYGISIFGNKNIEFIGELDILMGKATENQYFALDCLYVYLPVVVGIIPTIVIGCIYAYGIKKCFDRNNIGMLMIMLLFLISAISDSIVISQMCAWIYLWTFSVTTEDRELKY